MLTTSFAAIAAVAALTAVIQAGRNHRADAEDRARERKERREQFNREADERLHALEDGRRARILEQLGRIGRQVAIVRETARAEANEDGSIRSPIGVGIGPDEKALFFWNSRSQLSASLAAYRALGGTDPLTECQQLATGSTMDHLMSVVGTATGAFDELARANEGLTPPPPESADVGGAGR